MCGEATGGQGENERVRGRERLTFPLSPCYTAAHNSGLNGDEGTMLRELGLLQRVVVAENTARDLP